MPILLATAKSLKSRRFLRDNALKSLARAIGQDEPNPAGDPQFAVNMVQVDFDGALTEAELFGNRFIGQPFGDELKYLRFATGETLASSLIRPNFRLVQHSAVHRDDESLVKY